MEVSESETFGDGSAPSFTMVAPLQGFVWLGDDFEFAPGLAIHRFEKFLRAGELHEFLAEDFSEEMLSAEERKQALGAPHFLRYNCRDQVVPSAGESVNLFLLSLWLVRPTRTRIAVRWRIFSDGRRNVTRMLDRFSWIDTAVDIGFNEDDLRMASRLYVSLSVVARAGG